MRKFSNIDNEPKIYDITRTNTAIKIQHSTKEVVLAGASLLFIWNITHLGRKPYIVNKLSNNILISKYEYGIKNSLYSITLTRMTIRICWPYKQNIYFRWKT